MTGCVKIPRLATNGPVSVACNNMLDVGWCKLFKLGGTSRGSLASNALVLAVNSVANPSFLWNDSLGLCIQLELACDDKETVSSHW